MIKEGEGQQGTEVKYRSSKSAKDRLSVAETRDSLWTNSKQTETLQRYERKDKVKSALYQFNLLSSIQLIVSGRKGV